jgi:BCCT family betaine/carnitine transporter
MNKSENSTDYAILFVPLFIVLAVASTFFFFTEASGQAIEFLNGLFVNKIGFFYILMGIFVLSASICTACSKYGKIRLGDSPPEYGDFRWGSMIFTSTMAADILYWSLIEWGYYYSSNPTGLSALSAAQRQLTASSYPLFHWGPIPWAFYILPSAAYAHMFYVSGRTRQTLSEACRPVLKKRSDGFAGKAIDIFSVVGLLAGTATTFSLATPLMSEAVSLLAGIENGRGLTVLLLGMTGAVFTFAVMFGIKAISKLAVASVWLFAALALYVFAQGPSLFIIESGISGLGHLLQNFISMSSWTDPLRLTGDGASGFPQQWTIFYWAYWISWFVATPFFIASISKGRTIRQMIFGSFFYGLSGTYASFIVFGNFGLYQQATGAADIASMLANGDPPSSLILKILSKLPHSGFVLVLLVLVMIALYASTFDAITMVVAGFCKKELAAGTQPEPSLRAFWSMVFIILPLALIWSESTLRMLQTLSIVAAFPLAVIMIVIILSFFRDLRESSPK